MLNKVIKIYIVLCISTMLFTVSSYANTVTTNVLVQESNIIKPSDKAIVSMGDTWDTWRMYLGDRISTETSKRYQDMIHSYQIPVYQLRMAGADANSFYWKDTLGTMEERGDGSPFSRNLGLVEWIKSAQSVNKDVAFTFALNIINDTVENHADLVRFLTLMPDDPNAVGSDGVNWAQKRIDLGIPNPVKLTVFELGNEIYNEGYCPISADHTVTIAEATAGATRYAADCKRIISAMTQVNPDIKFAMCGYSSGNGGFDVAKAWNKKILDELFASCDYIVDHKYYYDYNFRYIQYEIEYEYTSLLDEIPVNQRPELYFSEYGCWVESSTEEGAMEYLPWPTSLKGALTDAKFLNGTLINSPYTGMAALFSSSGAAINTAEQWGPGFCYFRIFDDGKIYATVPAEMLKIFSEAIGEGDAGENVVKTALSAPTNSSGVREHSYFGSWGNFPVVDGNNPIGDFQTPEGLLNVSSHTTKDGGLNLIIVNTNETVSHNIVATFENKYKLKEELVLTSDSLDDNNIPGTPDLVYTKRNLINSDAEFKSHYIPSKSIVVLKLVPINYTYTDGSNAIVRFIGQNGEKDGLPVVDCSKFGIVAEMYENKTMADIDRASIIIPNQGINAYDIIGDLSGNINNVCYLSQADVKRNIAYFDLSLGDAPDGIYQAIIGNLETGKYEIIDFYYCAGQASGKQIESIILKNAVVNDNIAFISNKDYVVSTDIAFNDEFVGGEVCKVTVIRGTVNDVTDRSIVNSGYINALKGQSVSYDFYMPKDAISGNYTIEVSFTKSNGNIVSKTSEFYFNKPDEIITITSVPKNQNNAELTFDNITQAKSIKFAVKNNSDKNVGFTAVTAFFNKDKKMLYTSVGKVENINSGDTGDVNIILNGNLPSDDVDYVSLYIFENMNNIAPYSNVYYIK